MAFLLITEKIGNPKCLRLSIGFLFKVMELYKYLIGKSFR